MTMTKERISDALKEAFPDAESPGVFSVNRVPDDLAGADIGADIPLFEVIFGVLNPMYVHEEDDLAAVIKHIRLREAVK